MPPVKQSQPPLDLDDMQKFALMKFRRSVCDITKPHHDDSFLVRWLRARKWDAVAAEKMLRESLHWREVWGIDTTLKDWVPPDPILHYYPSGLSGYDKDGCPVAILPFAGIDMWGLLHSVTRHDMVRMTIKQLELYLQLAGETGTNQVVVIIDMENFNIRQYAWRPAGELVIALIKMYEANYPEILRACYIVNAPKVFAFAWSVVKNFLNEYTISKIQIFKADPIKWKAAILERVPPDQLPKHWGGTMVDEDGDPRCPSKVRPGGKIPKSMYTKKTDLTNDTSFTTTTIKKGSKLELQFKAEETGSFLKWEFRSDDHDIKFGILCQGEDGQITEVVSPKRLAAHQVDEVGVIACQVPALYTVLFDNSYSYLRNKKIHYNIHIANASKLNVSTLPDQIASQTSLTAID